MKILTIDPGHTVGYAAHDDSGVIMAGSIPHKVMADIFGAMLDSFNPEVVIFERMPHSNHDSVTSNLYYGLLAMCVTRKISYNSVLPGHWKPVTPAQVANPIIAHTNDALRMLHYVTKINSDYITEALSRVAKEQK